MELKVTPGVDKGYAVEEFQASFVTIVKLPPVPFVAVAYATQYVELGHDSSTIV
jgi:hypothetical protein